jgi:serine phosphatase RsbU (regulator of sigma subunit)
VTEAEDGRRQPFGYDGVAQIVDRHASEPTDAIRDAVFAALLAHAPELADDATLLVVRRAFSA